MKSHRGILLWTVAILLATVAGCGLIYDDYPAEDEGPGPVTLVLDVGLAAQTRAAGDKEQMHSLRIVLLDMDKDNGGIVEYNKHITFDSGQTAYNEGVPGYQLIRTMPGNKKIFFIANEESLQLTQDLDEYPAESKGFEDWVNSIQFSPDDYNKMDHIPLSSSYEFTIGEELAGTKVPKEFYLVHAATKFEFSFINHLDIPLTIKSLSLSSIAERMYLMAHFEGNQSAEQKMVSWTQDGELREEYWVDWLKAVSDDTQKNDKNPGNAATNSRYGWITDYLLPEGTQHTDRTIVPASAPLPILASETLVLPTVYCPESRNIPAENTEQSYAFTITLKDEGGNTEKTYNEPLRYIDETGGDLVSLFRNTHVKVECILEYKRNDIALHLHVVPWYPEEKEVWDYTDHVTVESPMLWKEGTYERKGTEGTDDDASDVITLKLDGTALEGTFLINTPVNGRWHAYLTPIGDARPNAMSFVDENGDPETPNSGEPPVCVERSGYIVSVEGTDDEKEQKKVTLRIKPSVLDNDIESRYRLEFRVENMGMWIDAPVFGSSNSCTIVRPGNKMQ